MKSRRIGAKGAIPIVQFCSKRRRETGVFVGQVALFPRIFGQVVQFNLIVFIEMNQLPIKVS